MIVEVGHYAGLRNAADVDQWMATFEGDMTDRIDRDRLIEGHALAKIGTERCECACRPGFVGYEWHYGRKVLISATDSMATTAAWNPTSRPNRRNSHRTAILRHAWKEGSSASAPGVVGEIEKDARQRPKQ